MDDKKILSARQPMAHCGPGITAFNAAGHTPPGDSVHQAGQRFQGV
jgi:hypothetical protein